MNKHTVDLAEIADSGIPKNGIPSIDRPRFVSLKKARKWVGDKEPVMVVTDGEKGRAYPLQILIYHQIVNDTFGGKPIVVTFCPLCNNGLVMNRKVGGKTLTFGTTGLLRNSGLIMFDRQTQSWWQQFTGDAIVGDYAGQSLQIDHSAQVVSLERFAERFPNGKVLSRDTGFNRKYGYSPFQGYDSSLSNPILFPNQTDPRLPAKERVLNVQINETNKLYPFTAIKKNDILNDVVDSIPIVVFSSEGYVSPLDQTQIRQSSQVPVAVGYERTVNDMLLSFYLADGAILDKQSKSHWNIYGEALQGPLKGSVLKRVDVGVHFAFAALVFMPDAEVFQQ